MFISLHHVLSFSGHGLSEKDVLPCPSTSRCPSEFSAMTRPRRAPRKALPASAAAAIAEAAPYVGMECLDSSTWIILKHFNLSRDLKHIYQKRHARQTRLDETYSKRMQKDWLNILWYQWYLLNHPANRSIMSVIGQSLAPPCAGGPTTSLGPCECAGDGALAICKSNCKKRSFIVRKMQQCALA